MKGFVTTQVVKVSGLTIKARNERQASYGSLSARCSGSETELPALGGRDNWTSGLKQEA